MDARRLRLLLPAVAAGAVVAASCGSAPPGADPAAQPEPSVASGPVDFVDPEVGLAGRHPAGWHRARALTEVLVPREVLALATYPLRDGATAGECAPSTAREDMPPGGAFDFRPAPAKLAPHLRWQRAGGSWQGYRFSVWIAADPEASAADVGLAVRSGASLAVSGCGRDGDFDCLDEG